MTQTPTQFQAAIASASCKPGICRIQRPSEKLEVYIGCAVFLGDIFCTIMLNRFKWCESSNFKSFYIPCVEAKWTPTGLRPGSVAGPHPGSLGARLGALLSSCFESCSMSCIKRSPGDRYHLVMTNIHIYIYIHICGKIMKDPPCSMGESTISVYFYGHVQQLWDKLPEGTVTSLKSKRDFGNKHGGSS